MRDGVASWRSDPGLFPVVAERSYREFFARITFRDGDDPWGEGLLDFERFFDPCLKTVEIPADALEASRALSSDGSGPAAEVFAFGTGSIGDQIWVNGHRLGFHSSAELSGLHEIYEGIGASVHRQYRFSAVPAEVLRAGINEIRFLPGHAFVQVVCVRLFGPPQALPTPARESSAHPVSTVDQVIPFVQGPDYDLTGRDSSWTTWCNPDLERPGHYVVERAATGGGQDNVSVATRHLHRHCSPDGRVVERVEAVSDDRGAPSWVYVRPRRFYPFGFHKNGWHQDLALECVYNLGPSVERRPRPHRRAFLIVPHYGTIGFRFNGGSVIECTQPTAGYFVSTVELDPDAFKAENRIELVAIGRTGCFQPPGPILQLSGPERE